MSSGFDRLFGRYLSDVEINKVIEVDREIKLDIFLMKSFWELELIGKNYSKKKILKLAFDEFYINREGKLLRDEVKKVLGT